MTLENFVVHEAQNMGIMSEVLQLLMIMSWLNMDINIRIQKLYTEIKL